MSQGSDGQGWHPSSASIWYVNSWTWGEVVQMLMTASHATSTVTVRAVMQSGPGFVPGVFCACMWQNTM